MNIIYEYFVPFLLIFLTVYIIGGFITLYFVFQFLVKPYIDDKWEEKRRSENRFAFEHTLPLRLNAYERAILFIERIRPENILVRMNPSQFKVNEYHRLVVESIRSEYEHNITQQMYVDEEAWKHLRTSKDWFIHLLNMCKDSLDAKTSGAEFCKHVLTKINEVDPNPFSVTLGLLKRDLKELFE